MLRLQKHEGNWTKALMQPIVLTNATVDRLVTLHDAARLVSEHFDAQSGATMHAVELLLQAAETGAPSDFELATLQVLSFRQWI